jgi:hypothetical protein
MFLIARATFCRVRWLCKSRKMRLALAFHGVFCFSKRIQGEKIGGTNRKTKINNSRAIFQRSFFPFEHDFSRAQIHKHRKKAFSHAFQRSLEIFHHPIFMPLSSLDICSPRGDNALFLSFSVEAEENQSRVPWQR